MHRTRCAVDTARQAPYSGTVSAPSPVIDQTTLQARLDVLRAGLTGRDALIRELETFLRTAPEDQVVRINPIRYASDHGRNEAEVVDLFLHARKAGLFVLEWQYVCRVCGMIVESFDELNAAGEHFFCRTCIADRDADLSDYAEVGFTVSKAVRISRFHDPEGLGAEEYLFRHSISAAALARDGTSLRDFYSRHRLLAAHLEPGETATFALDLPPGFAAFTHGPEMLVSPSSDHRVETMDFTHRDGRPAEPMIVVSPGTLTYRLTNASSSRITTLALHIGQDKLSALQDTAPGIRLGRFLSGSRLLSTQTFLDLFPSETVMSAGGLAVKRVAIVFTDIKGSTALYERVGDLKAFGLVRQHFAVLRDTIAAHQGALVKTIGDAVMASFHEPGDAVRAALEMLKQMQRFNEAAGEDLVTLKIGAHVGPCIAVTLNERLDYFGQAVNLAARVQGLARENEFWLTDHLHGLADATDLASARRREVQTVRLKGIGQEITVHALGMRDPDEMSAA